MEKLTGEKVEERVEKTTVTTILEEIKWYVHQEHLLDDSKILANGFISRVVNRAELMKMLTAKLNSIYPVAVMEFLGYLDTEKLTTKVTCVIPGTHKMDFVVVDVRKILTEKLGLCDSGKVEEAGHWHYLAEFRRYANDDSEVSFQGRERWQI